MFRSSIVETMLKRTELKEGITARLSADAGSTFLRGLGAPVIASRRPLATLKPTGLRTLDENNLKPPPFSLFMTQRDSYEITTEEAQITFRNSGPEIRALMQERAARTRTMQHRVLEEIEYGLLPVWFIDQLEDMVVNSQFYVDIQSHVHDRLIKTCMKAVVAAAATCNCGGYRLDRGKRVVIMSQRPTVINKLKKLMKNIPSKPEVIRSVGIEGQFLFIRIYGAANKPPTGFCFVDVDTLGRNGIKRVFPKSPLQSGYDEQNRIPIKGANDHLKAIVGRVFDVLMESYRAVLAGAVNEPIYGIPMQGAPMRPEEQRPELPPAFEGGEPEFEEGKPEQREPSSYDPMTSSSSSSSYVESEIEEEEPVTVQGVQEEESHTYTNLEPVRATNLERKINRHLMEEPSTRLNEEGLRYAVTESGLSEDRVIDRMKQVENLTNLVDDLPNRLVRDLAHSHYQSTMKSDYKSFSDKLVKRMKNYDKDRVDPPGRVEDYIAYYDNIVIRIPGRTPVVLGKLELLDSDTPQKRNALERFKKPSNRITVTEIRKNFADFIARLVTNPITS